KHNWSLNTGSAGPLTLAGGTPTITVGSARTTINLVLTGSAGLTKTGSGRLVLGGPNSYTGTTTAAAGTLTLGSVALSATSPVTISSGAVAESAGTLSFTVNATATAI